jgi:hypothetical protein
MSIPIRIQRTETVRISKCQAKQVAIEYLCGLLEGGYIENGTVMLPSGPHNRPMALRQATADDLQVAATIELLKKEG